MSFINKLLRNDDGATAIEYGLIAALIAVAAISALGALGTEIKTTFETAESKLSDANKP